MVPPQRARWDHPDDRIQHGVGNLIRHFVRMAFRHGPGGKDGILTHGATFLCLH